MLLGPRARNFSIIIKITGGDRGGLPTDRAAPGRPGASPLHERPLGAHFTEKGPMAPKVNRLSHLGPRRTSYRRDAYLPQAAGGLLGVRPVWEPENRARDFAGSQIRFP